MGSKKSSSQSQANTSQADNRIAAGEGAFVVGTNGYYSSEQDNSLNLTNTTSNSNNTSNSGNTWANWQADNSVDLTSTTSNSNSGNTSWQQNTTNSGGNWDWQQSSNTTNDSHNVYTLSDSGALQTAERLGQFSSELLRSIGDNQSDAAKFLASSGADIVAGMGESLTNLYGTAGATNARAWDSTLNASTSVLDKMLTAAERTSAGAEAVAKSAIASYQPTENKIGDGMKYAAIAAAVLIALKVMK